MRLQSPRILLEKVLGFPESFLLLWMAIWHPVADHLLILYEDCKVIDWSIAEETQTQHEHTGAGSMAPSPDGNLLLTSDVTGSLSIWMVPKFRMAYKRDADDLATDLAFAADGTRFCDA